jgi:hypothetical protein
MTQEQMNVDDGAGRQKRVRVDYPANSKVSRLKPAEKGTVEKVVEVDVIRRKRGLMARIFGDFIADDSSTVFSYVITDVLIPAAKTAISDAVSQGIERMLFGDSRPRPAGRPGYTNYGNRYGRPGDSADRGNRATVMSRQARATHNFNDIIISSRAEAEDVIDNLRNLVSQFDVATVADLYDLVGLTGEFTDNKWGWTDLRSAAVRAVRGGYMLQLPRTQSIE